ncbi:MAG: hypothetical protein QOJ99_790 [Bryobacterales bacterium]|jgi:hypothetical protein|nr:hypothetical protein [Bryobacterales bacterium]
MRLFKCHSCGQLLHFENRQCVICGSRLGYLPFELTLSALRTTGDPDYWVALASPGQHYRYCENAAYDACNWLLPANSSERFCAACRHNRIIPDLSLPSNLYSWRLFEIAKHRLFYTLIKLELPLANRSDDPRYGLAFDFLTEIPGGPPVTTGHEDGLITMNLKEADDAERTRQRLQLGEPYRTLLGHFRHESGHYFWDRLVSGRWDRLERFRAVFGDERRNYDEALRRHYAHGPNADWRSNFITGYAACHPWEDFAETWAHYLHIVDTMEMAFSFGVQIEPRVETRCELGLSVDFDPHQSADFDLLIGKWLSLTVVINSLSRCLGEHDLYPFILPGPVITKMNFIHKLINPLKQALAA